MSKYLRQNAGHEPRGTIGARRQDSRAADRAPIRSAARPSERGHSEPSLRPARLTPSAVQPTLGVGQGESAVQRAPADIELERSYHELKAQLATAGTQRAQSIRAERRPQPEPAPAPADDFEFGEVPYDDDQDYDFAPSGYEVAEDWYDTRPERPWLDWMVRRVVVPTAFVLGLVLCAGAIAWFVLATPTDGSGPVIAAEKGLTVKRAAAAGPAATLEPKQEVASGALAAPAEQVTVLEKRAVEPAQNTVASTPATPSPAAEATEPVQSTPQPPNETRFASTAPRTRAIEPSPATNTIQFAPTTQEPNPYQSVLAPQARRADTLPSAVSTLTPAPLPNATTDGDLQPLAFAPTPPPVELEPDVAAATTDSAPPTPPETTTTARATTYVNMRAGPNNQQPVLKVVPANGSIEVVKCRAWCEVVYEGQRGWIYKGFVDRSGTSG